MCSLIGASRPNKDLVLDLSGIGNMFGAGPEIPIILQYEPRPITRPLARVPTAFPVPRSLDVKSGAKSYGGEAVRHHRGQHRGDGGRGQRRDRPQEGQEGSVHARRLRYLCRATSGRFVVVGTSQWAENRAMGSRSLGNRDLFMNMINWLTADEDLISIRPKIHRRPSAHHDHAEAQPGLLAEHRDLPARRGRLRHGHLVEEEISR